MTLEEMAALFDEHGEDEFLKFERVQNKRSRRGDLHAMLLLDELLPSDKDIIGAAAHDVIYFAVEPAELAAVISAEQVKELRRCGVTYFESVDSLGMFP